MKAVSIYKHGDIDSLNVVKIDKPSCPNNKLLINIKACSINHLDIWVRNGIPGLNIPLPLILGSDGSGIVKEVGRNIDNFQIGDKIIIQPGTFNSKCTLVKEGKENYSKTYGILGETEDGVQAEYVVLNPRNIYKMPNHLSFEEAASMSLVFMTSYQMLIKRANLKPEETVLIYGATSGVGMAAIQIAKDLGSTIITTVGDNYKKKFAENIGADYVINHNTSDISKEIKKINKNGVDVIFEHIGPITWKDSLKSLAIGGRIVTCGATTGNLVSIDLRHLFMKQQSILGSTMASISTFVEVVDKINNKKFKPYIDEIFSFDEIKKAHMRMENRKQYGKIVVCP